MSASVSGECSHGLPEFFRLMPPLKEEERALYEANRLGFEGLCAAKPLVVIDITPSATRGYWYVERFDQESRRVEFTQRGVLESRMTARLASMHAGDSFTYSALPRDPRSGCLYPPSWLPPLKREPPLAHAHVYLVRSVKGGPIKIGVARCVWERLKQLQTGSPFPLEIVKIYERAGTRGERRLHEALRPYWLHGEWYDEGALDWLENADGFLPSPTDWEP